MRDMQLLILRKKEGKESDENGLVRSVRKAGEEGTDWTIVENTYRKAETRRKGISISGM